MTMVERTPRISLEYHYQLLFINNFFVCVQRMLCDLAVLQYCYRHFLVQNRCKINFCIICDVNRQLSGFSPLYGWNATTITMTREHFTGIYLTVNILNYQT